MSSLFGLLDLGAGAIAAQNAGVAAVGRNTSNVNTPGYQRESVDLQSLLAAPLVGGVQANGVTRADDVLLAGRERVSDGSVGHSGARSAALSDLQSQLVPSGTDDLVTMIASLWGGVNQLGAVPADPSLRGSVVASAQTLAAGFAAAAGAISTAVASSNGRIADLANSATELAAIIANTNHALALTPSDPVLADQRDQAARKLAGLIGGQARIDRDGKMRFVTAGGVVVVDGDRAAKVTATPDPAYANHYRVDVVDGTHSEDVTTRLDSGSIGGELHFRDVVAAQSQQDVDQLAYDLATQVNAVHRGLAGMDGVSGRDLFTQPTTVSGAAAAMAVNATIVADPRLLAIAAPGAGATDTSGVAALSALGSQPLAGGGTRSFSDEAVRMLSWVGQATASAQGDEQLAQARADALQTARDSVSGVSLQEEMQRLSQYQHASEAATQFVSTVNDLLDNLIQKL